MSVAGRHYRGSASGVSRPDRTDRRQSGRYGGLSRRGCLGRDGKAGAGRPRSPRGAGRDFTDLRAQESREAANRRVRPVSHGGRSGVRRHRRRDPSSDGRRCGKRPGRLSPSAAARSTRSSIRRVAGRPPRAPRYSPEPTGPISVGARTRMPTDKPTAASRPAFAGAKSGPAISSRPSCSADCRATSFREVRSVRGGRSYAARIGWLGSPSVWTKTRFRSIGPAVRQVLHPVDEPLLRSGAFTLTESREGRVVTGLVADGRGSGHGVGFCQWGAVGRARAGQDFRQILAAYFPGTSLERMY